VKTSAMTQNPSHAPVSLSVVVPALK
jgi:hypothetical protein